MDLLDFSVYHLLAIDLYPHTGITTVKKIEGIYPKIILYENILPSIYNMHSIPSLETTAINICVLAKALNKLYFKNKIDKGYPNYVMNRMHIILEYQLHYCMETISPTHLHIPTISMLMEGCLHTLDLIDKIDTISLDKILNWLQLLKSSLVRAIQKNNSSIYELVWAIRALCLFNMHIARYDRDETISMLLLELINRRNNLGLLNLCPLDMRTASISYHFFVIETLLLGHSHVGLDNIYEEAFALFNRLYNLSYNQNSGYFSFQKGSNIRYTAQDIGFIISSLNTIANWTEGKDRQDKLFHINQNSYISIISNFLEKYTSTIASIVYSTLDGQSFYEGGAIPLFPSRLIIRYPYPTIYWSNIRGRNLKHILSLCNCLLDIYEAVDKKTASSSMDMLLDILSHILG